MIKRAFDIMSALIALVVLLPLLFIIAFVVGKKPKAVLFSGKHALGKTGNLLIY